MGNVVFFKLLLNYFAQTFPGLDVTSVNKRKSVTAKADI